MDGIGKHFPAKNALDCMILHLQVQNFSWGDIQQKSARADWTQTQFPLGSSMFSFYETTTVIDHRLSD